MIKKTFIIWLSVIILISFSACNSENVTDMSEKTIVAEANSSSFLAAKTVKDILHGSQMFNIVDSKERADFVLSSSLNNVNTPEVPVFVYEIKLHDKDGKLRGSWKDSIRQVQNDDGSWW